MLSVAELKVKPMMMFLERRKSCFVFPRFGCGDMWTTMVLCLE
jgi:hypothetical protein